MLSINFTVSQHVKNIGFHYMISTVGQRELFSGITVLLCMAGNLLDFCSFSAREQAIDGGKYAVRTRE